VLIVTVSFSSLKESLHTAKEQNINQQNQKFFNVNILRNPKRPYKNSFFPTQRYFF